MSKNILKLIATALAVVLVLGLVACGEKPVEQEPEIVEEPNFVNSMAIDESPNVSALPRLEIGLDEKIAEKEAINEDSIGWLKVENTTLDDVVLFHPNDEEGKDERFYYDRLNINHEYDFNGSYYIDYRTEFGEKREDFPRNTVIYGHSLTDNPDGTIFSQLNKFKDKDFAYENPYVYFATENEGDMAWEIFAVFITDIDVPYNKPNLDDEEFMEVIDDVRSKSLYNYNIEVTPEDKVVTLSTCLYEINGVSVGYPNDYRYVVMAKLVPVTEILRENADFEVNSDIQPA